MKNLNRIKSVSLSLMKKESDINEGKAEYSKKISAKFKVPKNYLKDDETAEELVTNMYNDIISKVTEDADSIGIWIEYKSTTLENAISLHTLDNIKEYSKQPINPIYEFFKLTLLE
jgi:hypothetical protein